MSGKQNSLGKSLIKNHSKRKRFVAKDGHRHSTDLPDGRDWGRLNLHSVTEHTSLDDFLDRVQLADKEYSQEFHNVRIVPHATANGILSEGEKLSISDAQKKHKDLLCIPRRPFWDETTTKEQLDINENESFLNWRRNLASLNDEEHINLTPYEKNLEVWRQLWRVIEKSDVIVQIVDSRNPLLFRCEDLETYVKENDEKKINILLLNKADFLTVKQREKWAQYFSSIGVQVAFFSALQQMQKIGEDSEQDHTEEEETEVQDSTQEEDSGEEEIEVQDSVQNEDSRDEVQDSLEKGNFREEESSPCGNDEQLKNCRDSNIYNDPKLLSREELITFLKDLGQKDRRNPVTTIGLVGYPNVGKSSTINAVLHNKKVSVSATPGKTKHFQTLMVDPELCFCDCPGLVFPNFVSTKAEMVINGVLPIDQLTSHIPPVTIVASLIPREVQESTYSIRLPLPGEGEDPSRQPTAEELLNAHGYMRGFMTHRGLPDTARSARYILKDYVNGKLLYCHAPPGVKHEKYQEYPCSGVKTHKVSGRSILPTIESNCAADGFDRKFFQQGSQESRRAQAERQRSMGMLTKNKIHAERMIRNDKSLKNNAQLEDPKAFKKHHNRNKKQKLRKIHFD